MPTVDPDAIHIDEGLVLLGYGVHPADAYGGAGAGISSGVKDVQAGGTGRQDVVHRLDGAPPDILGIDGRDAVSDLPAADGPRRPGHNDLVHVDGPGRQGEISHRGLASLDRDLLRLRRVTHQNHLNLVGASGHVEDQVAAVATGKASDLGAHHEDLCRAQAPAGGGVGHQPRQGPGPLGGATRRQHQKDQHRGAHREQRSPSLRREYSAVSV